MLHHTVAVLYQLSGVNDRTLNPTTAAAVGLPLTRAAGGVGHVTQRFRSQQQESAVDTNG